MGREGERVRREELEGVSEAWLVDRRSQELREKTVSQSAHVLSTYKSTYIEY